MVDYIIGVSDPMKWHSENLKMNSDHYASWMVHLGGARLKLKYGVVRMNDLVQDILDWNRLYLSGRLQKPVHMLVDNLDIEDVNSVNKRAEISAALLLLPSKFMEEDLYAKICSLSYMGDLRMFFAEDTNKVNKIVKGQFNLFQSMYKPFLEECETKNLLRSTSAETSHTKLFQDYSLSATRSLVSSLPASVRSQMRKSLGEKKIMSETGRVTGEVCVSSREEAAKCMEKVMRRRVMVSSARQAVAGFLVAGAINATMYLCQKMRKAWNSRA